MLRWIDELNGISDAGEKARDIRAEIRALRKEKNSAQNKRRIRQLYKSLDDIQFKPDYMCLIIDKDKDYYRACRGFSINGIRYKRLLGTNGGIKNSTIVFVSERLYGEIQRRVENGRDDKKELVTARLEAYRALTCSASSPVSMPHGVLIVDDAKTEFDSDVLFLTDEVDGEPIMEERLGEHIVHNATDGFGLMLPSLAGRWSAELGLDYVAGGMNTRFSFEKGMVFAFDFVDFAEKLAGSYIVKDAWGNDVDVRSVELILTTSMVKLWSSYPSCKNYIDTSISNGYTFGVSKTCPDKLESERTLNYQFIQSYDLSDDDIDELISPTMNEIRDVLGGDWRKTVLFLKGSGLNESNVAEMENGFIKAMMIDRRVLDDAFVKSSIYQLIQNRINEAKIGSIKVHGNYSIASGDPYVLCQNMFGLEKTGLLRRGEIYNRYWVDAGVERLACFRAPMTCHNNIRLVRPCHREDAAYWYRYMRTSTVFNAFDTAPEAMNGMDFDGDIVMLTDNRVLVDNLRELPALICAQRNAPVRVSSESDFIRSNIDSFGNDIGQTTNWITSMFDVRSHFEHWSDEYDILSYRIRCGQLFQQNAIDKAKGIVCKPMPRSWHDRYSASSVENVEERELYRSIVADKKPYFMRYIYPALMKQYNTYIKNTNRNALREFRVTVSQMRDMPYDELSDRQREFLSYYSKRLPVGTGDCVMNKICRRFEDEFDGYVGKHSTPQKFDYRFMRSDAEYTPRQLSAIRRLRDDYNRRLSSYAIFADYERVDEYDSFTTLSMMDDDFRRECSVVCPNSEALCNIILDLCYTKSSTKRFAWSMCGDVIIRNLLRRCGGAISYPYLNDGGELEYCGNRYSIETIYIGRCS